MYETTAESNSSFMEWAAARIAKEVEDNERIEAAAGTRHFIPGSNCNRITHRLSTEEKAEVVKKIDAMRDSGISLETAADQSGIHKSTYALWRRQFKLPNYQLPTISKTETTQNIMTDNLNEPPLADIIMDVRENFIYLRNENLRLQEENNQLKQAIAALKDEATNSL